MVQGRMIVKNGYTEANLEESYHKLTRWNEAFLRSIRKASEKSAEPVPAGQDTIRVQN